MAKLNGKEVRARIKANFNENYFTLNLRLPKQWVITFLIALLLKYLPEWWSAIDTAMALVSK